MDAILLVCRSPGARDALAAILEKTDWRIGYARSCGEAVMLLCREQVSVVICESRLPDGDWKDMLEYSLQAPGAPRLIVTCRWANESLWAEVLNLGGFDVLAQPFDNTEVTRVTSSATRARQRALGGAAA